MLKESDVVGLGIYYDYGEELLVMEMKDNSAYAYDLNGKLHYLDNIEKEEIEDINFIHLSPYGRENIERSINKFEEDKLKLNIK